jgi:hypothetical protein
MFLDNRRANGHGGIRRGAAEAAMSYTNGASRWRRLMAKEILCGFGHPGVRFATMNELADDFARRSPRKR